MEVCDSLWALAAFAGWILLGFAVALIVLLIQKCEQLEASRSASQALAAAASDVLARFAPFDADQDGFPGGRKRHDPYIER